MPTISCDAIVFDVGGTLLDVAPDAHRRAFDRIAHLGTVPFDAFRDAVNRAVAEWQAAGGHPSEEDLPTTWERHYERALGACGFTGDCAEAARIIEAAYLVDGWSVFPDAPALLQRLHSQGRTLGIISNWPASLESSLDAAGLRRYFSVIIGSAMTGYAKPHAEIYATAARQLDLDPSRVLYVGDSVEHDFIGAQHAGFQSVLLDRHAKHDGRAPRIASLDALETLLAPA